MNFEFLQRLSYPTRVKILWSIFVLVAVGLTGLIMQSIKDTIGNAKDGITRIEASKYVAQSPIDYATVERVELTEKVIKVYFNFNNPTLDILNVPRLSNIYLKGDGLVANASKITDRQGNPFVQKVLSKTQNFGIAYFPNTFENQVELIFDELTTERNPSGIFRQTLELNLNQLSKSTNVRN